MVVAQSQAPLVLPIGVDPPRPTPPGGPVAESPYVLPGSGFVIPVRPLRPGTAYALEVTFANDPGACGVDVGVACRTFTGTVHFTTAGANMRSYLGVHARRARLRGTRAVAVTIERKVDIPALRGVRVAVDGQHSTVPPGGTITFSVRGRGRSKVTVVAPPIVVGGVRVRGATWHLTVR
jgi:hypothetical protein